MYVATGNKLHRFVCGLKAPFAFLVSGSYALVILKSYRYQQMTLKAFFVVMNNGKFTVRLIKYF